MNEAGPLKKNRLGQAPAKAFAHDLAGCTPSRGRDPLAKALTGATGPQPSGAALPSLIRWVASPQSEHVVAAGRVNPTATVLMAALPIARAPLPIVALLTLTMCLPTVRLPCLSFVRGLRSCPLFRVRRSAALPVDSASRGLNFSGGDFITELPHVAPIAGQVDSSHTLRERPRCARTSFGDWARATPKTNTRVLGRSAKSHGIGDGKQEVGCHTFRF